MDTIHRLCRRLKEQCKLDVAPKDITRDRGGHDTKLYITVDNCTYTSAYTASELLRGRLSIIGTRIYTDSL